MKSGYVVLDPGHGYGTNGKRSRVWPDGSQLFEWEFNRDISKRIRDKLTALNIPASILVEEARDIPLKIRVERANRIFAFHPDSFLISIHGNAGGGEGWEVWTSPGETESDKIATFFYNQAKSILYGYKIRSDYSDEDPDKESSFYILKHTLCPAILTENLFYDDPEECRFMLSDFGRALIAKLHVVAIQDYLKQKK